jgi:hypothetical protein
MAKKRPTPRRNAPRSHPGGTARSAVGSPAATDELAGENQRLVQMLGERMKELRALHQTAELLRRGEWSTGELLARVAALLPPAFQHPEVAAAAVEFCELVRATPGFREGGEELQAGLPNTPRAGGRPARRW